MGTSYVPLGLRSSFQGTATHQARACWAISILFHATLAALSLFGVEQLRRKPHAVCDAPISVVVGLRQDPRDQVAVPAQAREDELTPAECPVTASVLGELDELLRHRSESAEPELTSGGSGWEDIAPAGNGDERPAAGTRQDLDAGSLVDPGEHVEGEVAWAKIRGESIGLGSPGDPHGLGDRAAASGEGGGGEGRHGLVGNGTGYGTQEGTGSGAGAGHKGAGDGKGTGSATGEGSGSGGITHAAVAHDVDGGRYPPSARSEQREGDVRVRVEVLTSGRIGQLALHQSSGSDDLDRTALAAARKWRFKPAYANGTPVVSWVVIVVRYKLIDR